MNAADIVKYGHFTLMTALDGVANNADQSGVCGIWSVKDIVAHLASYEHILSDVLTGFVQPGQPTPYFQKMAAQGDQFNDFEVAARQTNSYQEVLQEYEQAYQHNAALVAQIPAETLRQTGTIPWYGAEYAVDDYLVYAFYGHKREHSAQIDLFKDRLRPAAV